MKNTFNVAKLKKPIEVLIAAVTHSEHEALIKCDIGAKTILGSRIEAPKIHC